MLPSDGTNEPSAPADAGRRRIRATEDDSAESSGLDSILRHAVAARASDVHLAPGSPALQRIDNSLVPQPQHPMPLRADWLLRAFVSIMTPAQREEYEQTHEVDLSYAVDGAGRFRVNIYQQLGEPAGAFRLIPTEIKSLEELGAPPVARELAMKPRGLVLVTGPTGSGKSTTLTGMIDAINEEKNHHIITIEDPIEFVHTSKKSLINQREVGRDTASFREALRRVLRQDPDVILIGELRDPETMQVALSAAETGHLVLGTLHTQGAAKSINRIIDSFPAHQQNQIRTQLGDTLQGVISQTLLRRAQSSGRVAATEVMVSTPAVANLIREGQVSQLYSAMQTGTAFGMHTLDQNLRDLVAAGTVSKQEAAPLLTDPHFLDNVHVRPADLDAEAWADQSLLNSRAREWQAG